MANSSRRARHRCRYCHRSVKSEKAIEKHLKRCALKYPSDKLDELFVVCAICGFHAKSLGKHVSDLHNMTPLDYKALHGQIKCSASFEAYSKQNKLNGDWISRANQTGKDLTEYKKRMSNSVSNAILMKPEERERRSKLLSALNKTDEFRKKSSTTAMITSTRVDVLQHRTERLRKWRKEHPDDFYEKCVKKFSSSFNSKPERLLRDVLNAEFPDYEFIKSSLKSDENFLTTKTHRRQLDALSSKKKVVVEFDGIRHFDDDAEKLSIVRQKDVELNEALPKMGYLLVRISYDQFSYRMGGSFSDECKKLLFNALKNPAPGLLLIGKLYDESYQ